MITRSSYQTRTIRGGFGFKLFCHQRGRLPHPPAPSVLDPLDSFCCCSRVSQNDYLLYCYHFKLFALVFHAARNRVKSGLMNVIQRRYFTDVRTPLSFRLPAVVGVLLPRLCRSVNITALSSWSRRADLRCYTFSKETGIEVKAKSH